MIEKVTIGIPTYRPNLKKLRETINSIISQDYKNISVVISENFPENNSIKDFVTKFDQNLLKIKYFNQKDFISQHANWDFVLDKSDGKYCMVLGDDDKISKNYISSAVKILEKDPDIYGVAAKWQHKYPNGDEFSTGGSQHEYLDKSPIKRCLKYLFNHNDVYVIAVMRTSIAKKVGWKKSNLKYLWPNSNEIANSLTPFIFGCLLLGKGYFNTETAYFHTSIKWPRNKKTMNLLEFIISTIKGFLRYMNLYIYFILVLFRFKPLISPIIILNIFLALLKVYYYLFKKSLRKIKNYLIKNEKLF